MKLEYEAYAFLDAHNSGFKKGRGLKGLLSYYWPTDTVGSPGGRPKKKRECKSRHRGSGNFPICGKVPEVGS
ncbi:hypothetical protein PROFUN_07542 [Planoprotostelium fungivorum]|uniref:Uncharacterized protein n=1 Tax=Planoprotostelium fungivorum TaxID=1890364 RepID=A0A2P6NLW0_9EUKA|nr:hypothetical protein PROFUN_07542 [Planoprotostelium fungivorum]